MALVAALSLAGCGDKGSNPASTKVPIESATPTQTDGVPGSPSATSNTFPAATANNDEALSESAATFPKANAEITCPPATTDSRGALTLQQLREQLNCVVAQFPWPLEFFPDVDALMDEWEESGVGDVGDGSLAAYTILFIQSQCAWDMTWLDARKSGKKSLEREALYVIVSLIPNWSTLIPGFPPEVAPSGPGHIPELIAAQAQLGDASTLQKFVNSQNCRIGPWRVGPL